MKRFDKRWYFQFSNRHWRAERGKTSGMQHDDQYLWPPDTAGLGRYNATRIPNSSPRTWCRVARLRCSPHLAQTPRQQMHNQPATAQRTYVSSGNYTPCAAIAATSYPAMGPIAAAQNERHRPFRRANSAMCRHVPQRLCARARCRGLKIAAAKRSALP
jgi:hypothetical protein